MRPRLSFQLVKHGLEKIGFTRKALRSAHINDLLGHVLPVDLFVDLLAARETAQQVALLLAPEHNVGFVEVGHRLGPRRDRLFNIA